MSTKLLRVAPLPNGVDEAALALMFKDFDVGRTEIIGREGYLLLQNFDEEQSETMDFMFADQKISVWDANIDLSDRVQELYEQAKKSQATAITTTVITNEKKPEPTVEKAVVEVERPHHENSSTFDIVDLDEHANSPKSKPQDVFESYRQQSPEALVYRPEDTKPLDEPAQELTMESLVGVKSAEMSPEPIIMVESLVKPKSELVRPFEKKPKEQIPVVAAIPAEKSVISNVGSAVSSGNALPSHIWTIILVAYFLWMSL